MKNYFKIAHWGLVASFLWAAAGSLAHYEEIRWDWATIDTQQLSFPSNFLWGVGVSEYQISGAKNCPDSNWATWEKKQKTHLSGNACDSWNKRDQMVDCVQQIGAKSLRLSLEWSIIEPVEGEFDNTAIEHYKDLCGTLLAQGITPVLTLHHFTHPEWFEKKQAFEKRENTFYFVRFCTTMFKALGDKVHMWCTINEPTVYMLQGYMRGVYPPGKCNMGLAGKVLKNLLDAHVQVYKKIKQLPHGDAAQIGIVHNVLQFHPYDKNGRLENMICKVMNNIMNDSVINFFKKGKFKFRIPLLANLAEKNIDAIDSLDFIGLNYYSHVLLQYNGTWSNFIAEGYRDCDIKTDMPYPVYAEGMYDAIERVSVLNTPIYITENGIADKNDDRRELFINRYMYALSQAIADGYDVRGYFYWSLFDNFEWDMGYTQKFGLYDFNFDTHTPTLRPGAAAFSAVVKKFSA
ncbi:MAG: family 1 glycosylhydrolase [Candidatus Babeliaceae bacterium]|jgi:beta-glucosidase